MMNKNRIRAGILGVSMLTGTAAAINGNIAEIAKAFPDMPVSSVELISTIPSFSLIVSVLSSTWIAKKIGMKKAVLTGVLLAALSGVLPFFLTDLYAVLATRLVFGFGIGLFNSLLVTYIAQLFDGEERTEMIGFHQAMGSAGGIVITFVSGQLLRYGWHVSFLSYAVAFVSFILFFINVPSVKLPETEKSTDGNTGNMRQIIPWLLLLSVTMICYMTYGIKISSLIAYGGYGETASGSYVIMALCFGAFLSGTSFAKLLKVFGTKLPCIGYFILAVSMFLLSVSRNMPLTLLAGLLSGIGNAVIAPFVLNDINERGIRNAALASSLVYVACNLGSAMAPYGAVVISAISPFAEVTGLFMTLSVIFALLGVILMSALRHSKTA